MLILNAKLEAAQQAIREATVERPEDTTLEPARFVLMLKSETDRDRVVSLIEDTFSEFDAQVIPFSGDELRLMLLSLQNRLSRNDYPLSFEAGYKLIDAFGLQNIEPEVITNIYVEPDPSRAGSSEESVDDFPPGCWEAEDGRLEDRKRWALECMEVEAAWELSPEGQKQGTGIVIAQPDTGVTSHPELQGVEQKDPFDLLRNAADATDPLDYSVGNASHGTKTGGVMVSPLPEEIAGSAPKAIHMPIRTIHSVVRLSQMRVAEAIHYAIDHGAHVITMSLGGAPSISLWFALRRAVRKNLIVLAAAGNCVQFVVYPARYNNCIAIGGSNFDREPWKGSCRGPSVAVSAPAENVYSAYTELIDGSMNYSTKQCQGTSFAVALTAGVAACWLAHHGRDHLISEAQKRGETLNEMFRRLVRATASKPNGWNTARFGAGIVNARRLLEADLDTGSGEAFHFIGDDEAMPGDSLPAFVFETTGSPDIVRKSVDWDVYGTEIALAMLRRAKGSEPAERGVEASGGWQAEAEQPQLSPSLTAVIRNNQTLNRGLGR